MDVLLDTSSLSEALKDSSTVPAFIGLARRSGYRFLVIREALDEAFARATGERLIQKASGLERLLLSLGDKFDIADSTRALWLMETQARLTTTPLLNIGDRKNLMHELAAIQSGHPSTGLLGRAPKIVRDYKEKTRDLWQSSIEEGLRDYKSGKRSAKQLGMSLLEFGPKHIDTYVLTRALAELLEQPPTQCVWILKKSDRYKSLRAYFSMSQLLVLGSSVPADFFNQHPLLKWLKYHPNNHVDLIIASAAAYGSFFLTEDKKLAELCRFLRSRGCLDFRTYSLKEFQDRS